MDTDTVLGFTYLNDMEGQPSLLLRIESPRDFNRQGRQSAIMTLAILLLMDFLVCAIVYFLTSSNITSLTHKKDEEIALKLLEESRQNALELERRVDERTRELEAKNKDLETFNYSVSHDLKAPLRAISGFSSLLENEYAHHLDETGSKYLRNIVDSTERMNMLIEDFLAYSKISKIDFSRSDFDLSKCLDSIEKDYANEISTRKIDISKELEVANFITDKEAMSMVLRNLIDNAIKFTSRQNEPRILVQSTCVNQHILITVSDNGIGFDMKYNDKIFEIFQRTHLPGEFPGTGIGLALVKRAVEKLGGAIQTQSKEGEGSTFTLMLPNHTCEQ
mgnify:FL=1